MKIYKSYQRYHPKSHGMYGTSFYRRWQALKTRCENKKHVAFHRYGGRGITHPWLTFDLFFKDLYKSYINHVKKHGEKDTQLDRIDNNKNYSKKNCRWATPKENMRNSSSAKLVTYNGKTKCLRDWAEILNASKNTFYERLRRGWNFEEALLTPVRKRK